MKNYLITPFVITLMILLQSCGTRPIFYHSEASLPYFHSSTKTVFKLINNDVATNAFRFGIIKAIDNDTLTYVLLAPGGEITGVQDLNDVNLNRAIPLLPKQVNEFIKILNAAVGKWYTEYNTKEGISYEFLVAPENKIIPQSENVVVWNASFKFHFQNNEDGPLGNVIFGEGTLQYLYKITELAEMQDLINILSYAVKK